MVPSTLLLVSVACPVKLSLLEALSSPLLSGEHLFASYKDLVTVTVPESPPGAESNNPTSLLTLVRTQDTLPECFPVYGLLEGRF